MVMKPAGELEVGDRVRVPCKTGSVINKDEKGWAEVHWDRTNESEWLGSGYRIEAIDPDSPFTAALIRADEVRPGDVLASGLVIAVTAFGPDDHHDLRLFFGSQLHEDCTNDERLFCFGRLAR